MEERRKEEEEGNGMVAGETIYGSRREYLVEERDGLAFEIKGSDWLV